MKIQLSEHFTYPKLLRFTLPSIVMLVFSSIYGVVDGFFVSNFVGKTAFTAVNFIIPFLMILGAVGFMFGTGGGALIAKTMGEGDDHRANRLFSLIVYTSIGCGVVLSLVGMVLLRPLAAALGARGLCCRTASPTAVFCCRPSPPMCCNMSSSACLSRRKNPAWAWR